jgi:hypothetical protein
MNLLVKEKHDGEGEDDEYPHWFPFDIIHW